MSADIQVITQSSRGMNNALGGFLVLGERVGKRAITWANNNLGADVAIQAYPLLSLCL